MGAQPSSKTLVVLLWGGSLPQNQLWVCRGDGVPQNPGDFLAREAEVDVATFSSLFQASQGSD